MIRTWDLEDDRALKISNGTEDTYPVMTWPGAPDADRATAYEVGRTRGGRILWSDGTIG